jgi:ABC-type branched-subunit amino acid transport system ATPase component
MSEEILLEIRDLSVSFGGLRAVDDVTMDLRAGIVTALVGPNGAGKTTLFNLITGNLTPDAGDVNWRGASLIGKPPWMIARNGIARSFQDLRLFTHMTVEENVLTVMERSSWLWQPGGPSTRRVQREKVDAILEAVDLADKADVRAIDLAYAERKFLSLARIMATDAEVWLLDEPASGLDRGSYERFCALLRGSVARGITVCLIEHNLDIVVTLSDRIAFLDRGRLLADGEPQAVLNDPHLSSIYFGERAA